MCGIFATLCNLDIKYLTPFFTSIKHRGPDASTIKKIDTIADKNLVFGFHRLAIIDNEQSSMQPIEHDGLYLICNGEIYNYKQLIKKYGLIMNTGSDCEIILHLYLHFGRNEKALRKLLQELDAEFAFVMYDKKNKILMSARDYYGVRPLFYSYNGREISIASELKALAFQSNVKPFRPATYLFRQQTGEHNTISFCSWATPVHFLDVKKTRNYVLYAKRLEKNKDGISKKVNELLRNSVKMRMMSSRPLGCFLSGGVDSSLILSIASEFNPNIHCFTIGLEGGVDIDASKKVVAFLNSRGRNITHHIVHFTVEQGIKAIMDVIWALETYDITTIRASVPQYLLSHYISTNTDIKVLLSGEGSDEVNASYLYNRLAPSAFDLAEDSLRLVKELYMFDNLRADRTTSAFGLEVRVPFLNKEYVEYMFSLDPELRMCRHQIEKKILRDAFQNDDALPYEILYRKKEAFSDAVSSEQVSWYKSLEQFINHEITDAEFNSHKLLYKFNPPPTKEALFYRRIFDGLYPNCERVLTHYWMPKWIDTKGDPSATVLECYP